MLLANVGHTKHDNDTECYRETAQDMVILGYRVPKGTALMFPPHATHLSPLTFSPPTQFSTDRAVKEALENCDPKRSGAKHICTLNHGFFYCIGQFVVFMQFWLCRDCMGSFLMLCSR